MKQGTNKEPADPAAVFSQVSVPVCPAQSLLHPRSACVRTRATHKESLRAGEKLQ